MQYGIEVTSENIEFFEDMNRAIVRAIQDYSPDGWVRLSVVESRENSVIYIADSDLSKYEAVSGVHRRVKPYPDGKMHADRCRVEVYPLLDREIKVKFRSIPHPGLASVDPPRIAAIADTGRIETPWCKEADKEIKRDLTRLLASRTVTRTQRLNWVLRSGKEYGFTCWEHKMAGRQLSLQDYHNFFDGNFAFFIESR